MKNIMQIVLFVCMLLISVASRSQNAYQYAVDLTNVKNDKLNITLTVPQTGSGSLVFSFPKIIPGTYMISDYGRFISEVKGWDQSGKRVAIKKLNANQWKIANASALHKITYVVDDIFDSELKHDIYPMAATNIEEGKSFVFNTPGLFGFFEGFGQLPFTLSVQKPDGFYASTSLSPVRQTNNTDVFDLANVDELYDSPIMYSIPDTTTIRVANCDVLVSVYAPKKQVQSKQIAEWMSELLQATKEYLGGKLPTTKYAFLYYFKDAELKHSFPVGLGGALEHPTSSFYYLTEAHAALLKEQIVDVSSHEFFHIITPLTIASKEVKRFNFSKPVMSQHLWLYEGSTEYASHHVQVKYGLKSVPQFLSTLTDKITMSRDQYNDRLSFTELSRHVTDRYEKQYYNVYLKGALITACLDIYLLHLSDGRYGFRNLTYDLGLRFGRDRPFSDDSLFNEIEALTYPEIGKFLTTYVSGETPIPYEFFFGLAGIQFTPREERQIFSLGGFRPGINRKGQLFIQPLTKFNEFGKKMGYKAGDELYAFNGRAVDHQNFGQVAESVRESMKVGDELSVKVGRSNSSGVIDTLILTTKVETVTVVDINKLQPLPNPTPKQILVQKAWLTAGEKQTSSIPFANSGDVAGSLPKK